MAMQQLLVGNQTFPIDTSIFDVHTDIDLNPMQHIHLQDDSRWLSTMGGGGRLYRAHVDKTDGRRRNTTRIQRQLTEVAMVEASAPSPSLQVMLPYF